VAYLLPREQERVLSFARWRIRRPSCISHRQREALLRLRVDPEVGEAIEQTLVDWSGPDPMSSTPPPEGSGAYLLSISILILSLRSDEAICARLAATTQLYISSITLGELCLGVYSSPTCASTALAARSGMGTGSKRVRRGVISV
jgi:hypothetical protein